MSAERFRKAAVIGTGMMGPGIAAMLALGGVETTLVSRSEDAARAGVEKANAAATLLQVNLLASADCATLDCSTDMPAAVAGCDIVIESAPEDIAFKQALFAELEQHVRADTVLASNTSGLSVTEIARNCAHPERILTTHFWNPPHLVPLVEIVRGEKTDPAVAEDVRALLLQCRKTPVMVKLDRPGQLGNRLQMALLREALHIYESGIADVEDIDLAIKNGFGMRLPVYGLFEHTDIVGLDIVRNLFDYVTRDLSNQSGATADLDNRKASGRTGANAGQGYYDWSRKDARQVKELRDAFLLDVVKRYG